MATVSTIVLSKVAPNLGPSHCLSYSTIQVPSRSLQDRPVFGRILTGMGIDGAQKDKTDTANSNSRSSPGTTRRASTRRVILPEEEIPTRGKINPTRRARREVTTRRELRSRVQPRRDPVESIFRCRLVAIMFL